MSHHTKTKRKGAYTGNKGLGLVELLIAVGMASIVIAAVSYFASKIFSTQKYYDQRLELVALRQNIVDRFSCLDTIGLSRPAACDQLAGKNFLEVSDLDGLPMIKVFDPKAPLNLATGMGGSSYALRAACVECPTCPGKRKILIEGLTLSPKGITPAINPLTGKTETWTDLFNGIPLACALES